MFERNSCADLHGRVDHVGRVQAPSEPGLDHGSADVCSVHHEEGDRSQRFKLRQRAQLGLGQFELGSSRLHKLSGAGKLLRVAGDAVDQHALGERNKVRREVSADAEPVFTEDCRNHPRYRRLAV